MVFPQLDGDDLKGQCNQIFSSFKPTRANVYYILATTGRLTQQGGIRLLRVNLP